MQFLLKESNWHSFIKTFVSFFIYHFLRIRIRSLDNLPYHLIILVHLFGMDLHPRNYSCSFIDCYSFGSFVRRCCLLVYFMLHFDMDFDRLVCFLVILCMRFSQLLSKFMFINLPLHSIHSYLRS